MHPEAIHLHFHGPLYHTRPPRSTDCEAEEGLKECKPSHKRAAREGETQRRRGERRGRPKPRWGYQLRSPAPHTSSLPRNAAPRTPSPRPRARPHSQASYTHTTPSKAATQERQLQRSRPTLATAPGAPATRTPAETRKAAIYQQPHPEGYAKAGAHNRTAAGTRAQTRSAPDSNHPAPTSPHSSPHSLPHLTHAPQLSLAHALPPTPCTGSRPVLK